MVTDLSKTQLKNRQSIYLPQEMLRFVLEMADERQRGISFVIQQAIQYWMDRDAPDVRVQSRKEPVMK